MVVETKPVLSERVGRLLESLIQAKPTFCGERLHFLTEALRETEGQPPVTRQARVFEKFLRGMTLYIDENPIVGSMSKYRIGMVPYLEWSCRWVKREAEAYTALGKITLSEEDRKLLIEAATYWEPRCVATLANEMYRWKHSGEPDRHELLKLGVWNDPAGLPPGRISVDYGKAVRKGLKGIIEEAQQTLASLPGGSLESMRKKDFLDAVIIACDAVIAFAQRYVDLAEAMAREELDPGRRAELAKVAETCRWVPANPARTFYEALQSTWFIHLALHLERNTAGYSPGRISQHLYPLYRKDREEGRLTKEEALELLQLWMIKFAEVSQLWGRRAFEESSGNLFQNISLGGVTPGGQDATNEVDYLLIEAQKGLRVVQPTLSVLYHDKLPEDFLLRAADLVRTGIGMPAFFNNDVNIQRLLSHGTTLEDARNNCIVGCVEGGLSHTCNRMWAAGGLNMGKMLELTLHNGRDPLSGRQLGPQTGEADIFSSYEELCDAVRKQVAYFLPRFCEFLYTMNAVNAEYFPTPFGSALVDDCIKHGTDMNSGGARYYMDGCSPVGTIDLTDSLVAIKKLVFEESKITLSELIKALEADFEGHEPLYQMLLECPKYGNDDDYVDAIAREWYDFFWQEFQRLTDHLGKQARAITASVSWYHPLGARTGALPGGRKAGLPLADGSVSPSPGQDKKGPTALIRSASKVVDTTRFASSILNMKKGYLHN